MRGYSRRARLAASRRLSMSNLFEMLAMAYDQATALELTHPFLPTLLPRRELSFAQALQLTNLAAEALIRGLDLRKGQRVLLLAPEAGETLLLTAAMIKAGGIAVPLTGFPEGEVLDLLLREGGIQKALLGSGFFRQAAPGKADLLRGREGLRTMPVNRADTGPGELSLEEACGESSGFFLPYTLKPASVVLLSLREKTNGNPLLVMATSRALLFPARFWGPLLPVKAGERCLFLLPPDTPSSHAAAVLALCAGLRLETLRYDDPGVILSQVKAKSPGVLMATARQLLLLAKEASASSSLAPVRLWISVGKLEEASFDLVRECAVRRSRNGEQVLLLEFLSINEAAPLALFRLSLFGRKPLLRTPFLPVPPHRVKRCPRGLEGGREVAAIRGPAVTPGWWNDLEASLRAWREGWFYPDAPSGQVSLPGMET